MSGIILMRTAYCPGLVNPIMATQEESQFEDAFEDAESDHQTLKILAPKGVVPPQANGHVVQENKDMNGDLPESESAEVEYQEEQYARNGNMDAGDGYEGDSYYDEDDRYVEDGYEERQERHYEEGDEYVEEDQYVAGNQYLDNNQYQEGETRDGDVEEDQYYEDDQYEESQKYAEGDVETAAQQDESVDGGRLEEEEEEEGRLNDGEETYDSNPDDDDVTHEGSINEANEYAEDDAYSHDNYANEKEDSPPEDASESDQFIDNPDIDEFRPAASPVSYSYHHPPETLNEPEGHYEDSGIVSGGNSTDHGNNAHHSDVEFDIPNQDTMTGEEESGQVVNSLAEEDTKHLITHTSQSLEEDSVPAATDGKSMYTLGIDKGLLNVDPVENLITGGAFETENSKFESDSTEADQQREDGEVPESGGDVVPEPSSSSAAVPSKTGSLKDHKQRSSRPENSMQYKESKELESILHSNLNALISQKPKVEEEEEKPAETVTPEEEEEELDQGKSRQKPNQAIPKHLQGPSKSAQSLSPKGPKDPTAKSSSPRTKAPGGPRRQMGPRPARGRGHPEGGKTSGGSKEHPSSSKVGPPKGNQGSRRPQRGPGTGGQRGSHQGHVPVQSPRKVKDGKGPGSAKPVSELKTLVQRTKQEILDLDKMLASTGNTEDDLERQVAMRVGQHSSSTQQKAYRHSVEYESPSHIRGEDRADQELRYSKQQTAQGLPGNFGEEPRNNSNGNHLRRSAGGNAKFSSRRPHSSYYPSYSRNIEESLVSTPGEVVFDDIAECTKYLQEKEYSMEQRAKSEGSHLQRRRRNSYERANRDSTDEDEEGEDPYNSFFPSGGSPSHGGQSTHQEVGPMQRSNHEVFARLEDDYGADDSGNADDHPDSTQPSVTSDVSTPSTPGSQSTGSDPKSKLPPGINPLEYDAVGVRLAEHGDDSSLTLSSMSTQPVPDQFSDADEEDGDASPAAVGPSEDQPYQPPPRRMEPAGTKERILTQHPPRDIYQAPPRQVDIGKTMEELKSISTSKTAQLKTPTFYIDKSPSPWVLQPDVAMEQEEQDRIRRMKIEMKRKEREYQQLQRLQRDEFHQKSDPQCYIRQDEEETEPDTDNESKQLMSEEPRPSQQNFASAQPSQKMPGTMRAPDLPPTTGRIKEGKQFTRKVLLRGFSDYVFHQATQMAQALKTGIRYPAAYLGSTQLITTKQPTRKVRMQQAQEAVNRIKRIPLTPKKQAPEGEEQPSKEVDLAISNERIQVLNADSQETMMDHPLKTISYIADIGNIVVIMARRRSVKTLDEAVEESGVSVDGEGKRQPRKIICHVFETEDAQLIAQTIGQAFALAYLEFLKVNGIDDAHVQEMDYHDVLNSQEIYGDDLMLFSNKECEKEALVEKERGEIMGMVIVESGWGSLIPTVVVANMSPFGAAARSGKLNIGDQIMAINGTSLVGLPLHECQNVIKSLKSQALVKFNIVSCPPVTQVLIKRPDTKYQLGFSVQNGIICSLMRGGIAERGGVRVGHRIIEINGTSVVATPHEKIVDLLSTSVGEIRMKTMPLSMYKLLTGQEQPVYI
ncbi:uncharacterized protein [Apostichopus japonicus]|uniref:uncharacterized protein isoform X4 n=1 Tax=Stichopus japonicus TaxID=307972 RepID=UPI003AB4C9F1